MSDKMTKVGIILGVFFLIITILVFFFVSKMNKEDKNVDPPVSNVVDTIEDGNKENNIDEPTIEPVEPTKPVEPEVVEPVIVEKEVIKEVSAIKTISESTLKEPVEMKEVITVISNKRLILLDESPDTQTNKMLTYCFDVLTPENENLIVFITKSVYDTYKVGDKLTVSYSVYTNDLGVKFPVVSSVKTVE